MTITTLTALASPQWHDGNPGFFPAFPIFGLLFLGLVAAAAFWFGRRAAAGPGSGDGRSAEAILAERYARGEMSDDEYLQRQSVLRDHRDGKKK